MKANIAGLAILIVALGLYAPRLRGLTWTPSMVVGAVIAVVAFGLLVAARLQLGDSFSVRAKAHRLVTTGLYARLRNPIYIFGCLFMAGVALVLKSWILLALAVVLVPVQMKRARSEEASLRQAFGEEYESYRRRTWF